MARYSRQTQSETTNYAPQSARIGASESIKGKISRQDSQRENGPLNGGPIAQEGTSVAGDMPWEQQQTSSVHGGFWEKRAKKHGVR